MSITIYVLHFPFMNTSLLLKFKNLEKQQKQKKNPKPLSGTLDFFHSHFNFENAISAALIVCAISSSLKAVDKNKPSNWDGGRNTPCSSISL